jgi:AraC-like DNA-binding protein/quercetin dioxygenase-like cupin family protein
MELDLNSTPERTILDLTSLGVPHFRVLGRYRYLHAHPPLADHTHPGMMEISYLARGTQNYWMGGDCYRMTGGDLFVTFPDEPHSTGPDPEHCGLMYWFVVELPATAEGFLGMPAPIARAYWEGLRNFPHRHCCAGPGLQPVVDRVFKAAEASDGPLRGARMHLALLEYLHEILALSQRAPVRAVSRVMAHVLEYIDSKIDDPLPVEALARESGLSLPRFKARFRAETGFPPAEFVLRRRIERASQLLVSCEKTVLQVALQVGFSSSQYFASAFRRITGMTPTAFREKRAALGAEAV